MGAVAKAVKEHAQNNFGEDILGQCSPESTRRPAYKVEQDAGLSTNRFLEQQITSMRLKVPLRLAKLKLPQR